MSEDKVLGELEKAHKLFRQGKFKEAAQLYKKLITNNPNLARSGININLAHSIILSTDWSDVSQNLPPGISYPESSGWIKSLMTGLPINYDSKPIPWYTYPAIEFIESKIASNFRVFEYGSGQSTLWWAERVLKVISIESNRNWFSYLQEKMPNNVELSIRENEEEYAANINKYQNNYFDVIIIDGINRNKCVELSLSKLKETGFIIFDNTDNYQYDLGVKLLELKGYKRIDFYGMIPGYTYKNCTSVFFKDTKLLDRGGLPSEKESCLGLSCFQVTSPRPKNNCMLTESNIAECQAKFNLSYHVSFARICQDLVGFEGKDVLEVGGSLPSEFVFDYLHVKSWSAIETPDYEEYLKEAGGLSHTGTIIPNIKDTSNLGFDNRKLEKYNFFLENIENLPQEYYGKYDLIFSIATFEHIHKLPAALDKMFLALKPGGKLFSMFSPIWSAYDGHHLPKITDRAGKVFDFGNSPIPPWGHLLMKPDELSHYLYQYTDKETAELMVDYVYNSPHINRYFTEDYLEFIKASKFSSKQVELIFENPIDEKTKENLEILYPGRKKFQNNGLLVVLGKLTNKLGKQQIIDSKKNMTHSDKSVLDRIIPPEIKNDEFSMAMEKIMREEDIKTVLEIGSSSGEGSTAALVKGISANPNNPTLFCIEVSQSRFEELKKRYQHQYFVKPYNVSSVDVKDIPKEQEVIDFYQGYKSGLNNYPLETVLRWFNEGKKYVIETRLTDNGIDKIKQENNVDVFDAVLIDGSEFTGSLELDRVYGAKYIMLDDINTFKNYKSHRRLLADANYDLVAKNLFVRNGYSIFKRNEQKIVSQNLDLPIHFFTIVLNGEPFIRYHIDIFKQLPFKWHWHIIEGVADLKHDTGWSLKLGGKITDEIHKQGRSKDGTSEDLDELAAKYPENVTIYRKPEGEFWDGKREMVNAPLANIKEECLLWQLDVDEIWTLEQICNARKLFIKNHEKTAAFYWCWYFVGENLVISTRNCYAQNPKQDWLRTWKFKPGYVWAAHEPPILVENLPDGEQKNVAAVNPFLHAETEKEGLIFQHFAYVTPEQLKFKEQYYGYQNAVSQWQSLQSQTKFPVYLREYFAWVGDNTMVSSAESLGIVPLVQKDITGNNWKFLQPEYLQQPVKLERRSPTILIDGVFFQLYSTGIARVWRSVLAEWAKTEFAQHIIVLDRVNTSPKIPGIRYRQIPAYNYNNTDADKQMLQQVCDEEGADLFISTYYTTPISTPSVFMAYDMIPEALETDLNKAMWREKHHAISHAFSYISISENTARDLVKFFPDIQPNEVSVAHCGVAPTFTPATTTEINGFKYKYGISKPYFLLVGAGSNYKNAILFFQAFAQLYSKQGFEIVCTGSGVTLANEYREYAAGSVLHSLILSDEELKVAYSGAVALVYPSLYEGFGMPVAEALACGCPVITCANSSIPEVAGEAAIYVDANDVDGLTDALCEVQKPKVRNSLIAAGLEQVKQFSWGKMADIMSAALMKATLQRLNLREINLIIFPDWSQPEETVGLELQKVIKSLVTHPEKAKMTLLIDNSNISAEDADLILSSVAMNLLMESELEVDEGPEIVLVGELSQIQWSALIAQLQGQIKLEHENEEAITVVDENLAVYEIQDIERLRAIKLETGGWELFKLSEINLIIFPDWSQPEETVGLELQEVIKSLVTHPDRAKMTLLIDNTNISAEDADLILSSVAMNLLMESELEVDEGPEIILLGELSQIQWSALIPQLQGRIKLEHENEEAKVQVKADSIPSIAVDSLKEKLDWIDLSSKQIIPKQDNFEKQPINKIKSEPLTEKDEAEKILSELEILEKGTIETGQPLGFFRQIGDVESYYEQTQKVVNDIHSFIFQNQDNNTAHQIAKWFTLKAKLFLYFSQANLKEIYQKRAEIIEFALKIEGYQVDYNFPERTGDRQKIRLGIIANNFAPHPETFATLPVYKHLNREEFEIILYYLQASGHPLERYCFDHANAAIELPEDLELQVKAIRKDELDILFISTNITSQTNAITLLASHRLARIQIVGMNSPVTTGMRHIDRYISSKLTDSETNAKEHYTEKLVTLDGPDQCFDFATEKELSVTTTISRKELNIDENTVVYISGANFYKIIPEVEATWVQIIAQVPNSMLLLYPFNPNWAPNYPIKAFQERFSATLSKYGVSEKRLLLLNALPNRADIKECLKIANIYLDAYPFSGMTSLIDPLQVCLPTVVMQNKSARSRRGASLLRYLEIPELIADSEDTYIQLAVNLGNNSDLRTVYRDRIETKMQANPQFLDSRYYSTQMGALFQKVFQEYLASDN